MSIVCQTWNITYRSDQDRVILTNKIWSPCKVGECSDQPITIEYLPGFIVQGYFSPKLETIVPNQVVLDKVNNWPRVSKNYILRDYSPFIFYIPDWNLQTKSLTELYIRAWNEYKHKL